MLGGNEWHLPWAALEISLTSIPGCKLSCTTHVNLWLTLTLTLTFFSCLKVVLLSLLVCGCIINVQQIRCIIIVFTISWDRYCHSISGQFEAKLQGLCLHNGSKYWDTTYAIWKFRERSSNYDWSVSRQVAPSWRNLRHKIPTCTKVFLHCSFSFPFLGTFWSTIALPYWKNFQGPNPVYSPFRTHLSSCWENCHHVSWEGSLGRGLSIN